MGGFHRAGTGKNKKVIEISPLLAFWPERAKEWKLKKLISLVRHGLFQILFLFLVPVFSLKIVKEKSMAKIGKFATFLTPFQASSTKMCLQVKSSHSFDSSKPWKKEENATCGRGQVCVPEMHQKVSFNSFLKDPYPSVQGCHMAFFKGQICQSWPFLKLFARNKMVWPFDHFFGLSKNYFGPGNPASGLHYVSFSIRHEGTGGRKER